ncbi:MAG TPA: MFS transporter [Caulobacteraceae bacterium]|jgi:MFS family permease
MDGDESAPGLLREPDYLKFWASRWMGGFGSTIQSVAMGWQVYTLSRRTLDVAHAAFNVSLIGLVTFVPLLLLALPAGETVDRRDRRGVLALCYGAEIAGAGALAYVSLTGQASVAILLAVAVIFGAARAFFQPALTALGPMLVPRALLPRAIAWNSLAGQTASVAGPAAAGLLVALSPGTAYGVVLGLYVASAICLIFIRRPTKPAPQSGSRIELVREGLAYVISNKVVLGAISLDLVAVLLGGATALLPAFARDVLKAGPEGFGILRMGPAVGATVVGLFLAWRPIRHKAGVIMLFGVAVFGAATVLFGYSRWLGLSVVALAVLGGADMLSVFVRQTLVQLVTPDHMRGRVAAVSTIFISASNELGEFESGLAARFLGVVGAAVFGGFGAVAAAGGWSLLFPALRRADRLE